MVETLWDQQQNFVVTDQSISNYNTSIVTPSGLNNPQLYQISEQASYSAWNMGNWDNFQKHVKLLDFSKNPYERYFYQAVLDIKSNKFSDA